MPSVNLQTGNGERPSRSWDSRRKLHLLAGGGVGTNALNTPVTVLDTRRGSLKRPPVETRLLRLSQGWIRAVEHERNTGSLARLDVVIGYILVGSFVRFNP
jgi:hypothetical protein